MATLSSQPNLLGVILAGGQSRRFGSDKALACLVNQQPNLLVMVNKLQPFCQQILVCANEHNFSDLQALVASFNNVCVICDQPALRQRGPLSGLAALATSIDSADILMVAVDYPTLPNHVLNTLATHPNSYLMSQQKAHYTLAHFYFDCNSWRMWRSHSTSWRLQDFLHDRGCSPLTTTASLVNCNYQRSKIDNDQEKRNDE